MQEMNQPSFPQQYYTYVPQPQPPVQKQVSSSVQSPIRKPYFGTDRNGVVFALILLCLSVLCVNSYLFARRPGLGASIYTVAILFTLATYLFKKRKTVTFYGIFCMIAYLAFAVSFSVTGSFSFFAVNALFVLSGVIYLEFMEQRKYDGFRSIGDLCRAMFVLTFGRVHYGVYALFHKSAADGTIQKRKASGVLIGIAIAVPFLAIIIPLLILSDAAFENLLSNITLSTLIEILLSVIFGVLVFVLLFSRALCIPREKRSASEKKARSGLEPVILVTFLSMIAALYVVYLFTQIAYFFNGFAGLLPDGFSVAEYARRGFFEMSIICAINLLIVFLANLLCKKSDGKTPRAVKLLSLFLCIFSLFLAATVLSKIGLYIHSFGMTRLRILTSLFTILLAVIFIAVSFHLFRKNVPYMKITLVAATLLLLFATYADVDRLVAAYNIRAYQSGKLDSIDMETISELHSPTVIPYVFELVDDADTKVSVQAKRILSAHADRILRTEVYSPSGIPVNAKQKRTDWRGWSYAEQQAADLLEENFD